MDARHRWPLATCVGLLLLVAMGANYRTQNFIVTAADARFAAQVGQAAEAYRASLAREWLGRELPPWQEPCSLVVNIHRDAFGATTFAFDGPRGDRGRPFGWEMEVNGSPERILDSVLPHEITHTILASHFQQRLPRWLDEGAASNCEHVSETSKQEHNLIVFLTEGRGIPFNRMFRMMEYPHDQRDMLALYAQGLSVVNFLLLQGEKSDFLEFTRLGLEHGRWDAAVERVYGFQDLSDLQVTWNGWVKEGSPDYRADQRLAATYVPAVRNASADTSSMPNRLASMNSGESGPTGEPPMSRTAPGRGLPRPRPMGFASVGGAPAGGPSVEDWERANAMVGSVARNHPAPRQLGLVQSGGSLANPGEMVGRQIGADLTDSWYYRRRIGQDATTQSPPIDRVDPATPSAAFGAWRSVEPTGTTQAASGEPETSNATNTRQGATAYSTLPEFQWR